MGFADEHLAIDPSRDLRALREAAARRGLRAADAAGTGQPLQEDS